MVTDPPRRRSTGRAGRIALRVLAWIGLLLVFVHAAVVGLLLHLDLPAGRRIVAGLLTRALNSTFQGSFSVGSVAHVSPYAVVAKDITVNDVFGKRVLTVSELRARADIAGILYRVLFGGRELDIVITHARAERAETFILQDPQTGVPTIARAFTPVPRERKPEREGEGRIVRVWLPIIELGHVYGRGRPVNGAPILEAEVERARGSVLVGPEGGTVDVERFGMVLRGLGGSDARGTGALHVRAPGAVSGRFDGHFGDLEVGAYARVAGKAVEFKVEVPGAKPEQVRALWPDWPLQVPVRGQAEAHGDLPRLRTTGSFDVDGATLDADGTLTLGGDVGVELDVRGQAMDLRAVFPDFPQTAIDAEARVGVWNKGGRIVVDANGTTQPTTIAGQSLPAVDFVSTYDERGLVGKGTMHEKGMPTKVDFHVERGGAIELDAHAPAFRIEQTPRLRQVTPARGGIDARAHARIERGEIQGRVNADVYDFSLDDMRLERGTLTASVQGPLKTPERLQIDAHLVGRGATARKMTFEKLEARARGPAERPKVEVKLEDSHGPNIQASGIVAMREGPHIQEVAVQVERGGARVSGKVSEIDLEHGRVSIDDLVLEGAGGTLRGTVKIRPDLVYIDLKGEDVDLEVIGRALGLPKGTLQGKLRVDADVNIARDVQRGRVVLGVGNASVGPVHGLSMHLGAQLDEERFQGDVSGQVLGLGAFGAVWDTTLAGSPLRERSWRDMIGTSEIQISNAELSPLVHLLPPEWRIERVGGKGYAELRLERRTPAALPTVSVLAATQGLEVDQRPLEGQDAAQALHIRGIDVQVGGAVSGETGDSHATTRLVDGQGVIVASSSAVRIDLRRAIEQPSSIPEQLTSSPMEAVIVVPDRNLESLPKELGLPQLAGTIRGQLSLSGSLRSPTFSADLSVRNLRDPGSSVSLPVDAQIDARYEKTSGRFAAGAKVVQSGRQVALLGLTGVARWQDLIGDGQPGTPRWTGGGQLVLDGFPLPVLAPLAEAEVGGRLYGRVALERHTALPQIAASVEIREASIDYIPIGTGRLTIRSDGRTLNTELGFVEGRGKLDGRMLAALSWDGLVPAVDDTRPVAIEVQVNDFDAVILSPMLREVLSKLSGRVNAELHATLRKVAKDQESGEKEWSGDIRGRARMRQGEVQIRALGLELRDVELDAIARDEDGRTGIHVTGFKAKARSQVYNVNADADLYLERLRLVRASASVKTLGRGIPIVVNGVSQADAKGSALVRLTREPDRMLVNVEVPDLVATIPRSLGRGTISLDENRSVSVIQPLSEPEVESGDRLPWRIVFDLGRRVRVARTDMDVPVTGQPVIELGKETAFSGYIVLTPGGHVQLFGKPFVIERGKIVFEGEASNPRVDIVAYWRAADGTIAYLEVHGTFEEPRLVFRSDPPLPEPQVMALLLGGPLGAASEVGNELIAGLFDETLLGRVELRAETEGAEETEAYTAKVRLRENLFFETTYRRGFERIDPNADTPDVSGTFDWQFRRNWSLRTQIGTLGTGVDLLWQYRY